MKLSRQVSIAKHPAKRKKKIPSASLKIVYSPVFVFVFQKRVFPVYANEWHEKGQNERKQGQNALLAPLPPARTSLTSRDQTAANTSFSYLKAVINTKKCNILCITFLPFINIAVNYLMILRDLSLSDIQQILKKVEEETTVSKLPLNWGGPP